MTLPRTRRFLTAGLPLGLALAITAGNPSSLRAQPMSSGSGAGTGTGMSGGAARNSTGTGQESGTLGGSTGTGNEAGRGPGGLPSNRGMLPRGLGDDTRLPGGPNGRGGPRRDLGGGVPLGPGVNSGFPGDTSLIPLDSLLNAGGEGMGNISSVSDRHLRYAQSIASAGDRSLALSRVASAATFSNQLDLADKALHDASAAAMEMPDGLIRDQRLMSIISAMMNLAEARLREGRADVSIPLPSDAPAAALPKPDVHQAIRGAVLDWRRAADLAGRVGNPTYRNEMMYRVADSLAFGSQGIINEFTRNDGTRAGKDAAGLDQSFQGLPDQMLQEAADLAARIDRPVWHDRGLVTVASAAAESRQFERALRIARMIPQPEVRTDALLKIAELQARRGDPDGATTTYREAAKAVASIPLDDPRAVLTGVLIDNLIAVGRFDDARASIGLYPDDARRVIALGAIAESMGRRGAAPSALAWINRDVPPQYRSQLYRRVNNGVVSAIEQNRSRDLSNRER